MSILRRLGKKSPKDRSGARRRQITGTARARLVNAIARGRRWLNEVVPGSVLSRSRRGKMQRSPSQHDPLASFPGTGSG
jgi:hypothetical protein